MKEIIIDLLIVFLFCMLTSCKTRTVYVPVDRVHTETVTWKDTIIDVRLEHIRDSVTVPDSSSYLSNKYAYSWAAMKGGMLTHSLGTWPGNIPVEVKYVERETRDSIPVPYEVKVYVYKEKSLTWWQHTRMTIGSISIILIVIAIGYFVFKKKS
ncbi:MAG: hypothetical protein LBK45_00440 [Tannerellaceae bacterium]|jgi:hypothetical protein|nr:hypothetical protein [Tannerellaceae bacterium]